MERVCLVTGATSGIGKATAQALAGRGYTVGLVARDRGRGEAAVQEIKAACGHDRVRAFYADLSVQAQVRTLGAEVLEAFPRLDVLINNAGAVYAKRELTTDGIERTLAVNHLAYFQLTQLLLERLKVAGHARIVSVSSEMQRSAKLDLTDLQLARRYTPMRAYANSKLANVMWTYELARRLAGSGVTANCLHPGLVATRIARGLPWPIAWAAWLLNQTPRALSSEDGARTSIFLADDPSVAGTTGQFFVKCRAERTAPLSYDLEACRRLWEASEALIKP